MERRNTKQRQIILDAVQSRCDHPTAEQIYNQVYAVDPRISKATVYRNLNLLVEEGKISVINLPPADRFDLTTKKHCHFVCKKCGKIFDIDVDYDEGLDGVKTDSGLIIESHQTIFKGICAECANQHEQ